MSNQLTTLAHSKVEFIDGDRGKNYPNKSQLLTSGYCLFLNTSNVRKGWFDFSKVEFIDEVKDKQLRKGKVKNNDIILTTRGTVGNVALVTEDTPFENIRINSGMVIVRTTTSTLNPYFLLLFFRSNLFEKQCLSHGSGSAQPQLPISALKHISLPDLDIKYQEKIVSTIRSLDKKIEINNQITSELESMAKILYDYWFVQFDFPDVEGKPYKSSGGKMVYNETLKQEIPEKWKACELGDYIEFKRGISYKGTDIKDNGVPFLNLNSFSLSGQFKLAGTKYFNGNFKKESKLNVGDLVIAITDVTRNADITGKAFVIPDIFEEQPLISCDVAAVFSETLTVGYLEQLFNSDSYHSYIKNYATGTLVLHLNLDGVNWFKTTLPPMTLLTRYEEYCKSLFKQRDITLKENIQLEKLRDWLLPMLMNGQVTVNQ